MATLTHTQPKIGHTHPHPLTFTIKEVTLTQTRPHQAKKMSHSPTTTHTKPQKRPHSPTPTHTQPRKGHTHPYPPTPSQKMVMPTHTQPKKGHKYLHPAKKKSHPVKRRSHPPTHNWKKECHMSSFLKKIDLLNLFWLNTFQTAFESIVCLFVFKNYLTTYQKIQR